MQNGSRDVANVYNLVTGEHQFYAPAHPNADDNGCVWSEPGEQPNLPDEIDDDEYDDVPPIAKESFHPIFIEMAQEESLEWWEIHHKSFTYDEENKLLQMAIGRHDLRWEYS